MCVFVCVCGGGGTPRGGMQGFVSDENAYAMGGISGHAGVFRSGRAARETARARVVALIRDRVALKCRVGFRRRACVRVACALASGAHYIGIRLHSQLVPTFVLGLGYAFSA